MLGPVLFTLYTTPHNAIISKFDINHHLYASDTQIYMSLSVSNAKESLIVHGPDMKTLPPPLGIFEDSDFWTPCYMTIQYLLVCTQNTGA